MFDRIDSASPAPDGQPAAPRGASGCGACGGHHAGATSAASIGVPAGPAVHGSTGSPALAAAPASGAAPVMQSIALSRPRSGAPARPAPTVTLLAIEEPAPAAPPASARKGTPADAPAFVMFDIGLRPMYLLAALWAAIAVPLWAAAWSAGLALRVPDPLAWHAHEMIFGFSAAVIVGFLLTAARNWSGRDTLKGRPLVLLAASWTCARVAAFVGSPGFGAMFDAAFFIVAAAAINGPILSVANRRSRLFPAVLVGLALLSGAFHLMPEAAPRLARLALAGVALIIVEMSGRVIPSFTANALRRQDLATRPALEWALRIGVFALLVTDAVAPGSTAVGLLALAGAGAVAWRAIGWKPWLTRGHPMLWMLHVAHAWLAVWLLLTALGPLTGLATGSAALHALTTGTVASLSLAMMMRTALGHGGQPIVARPSDVLAFGLITAAALLRVVVPLVLPSFTVEAVRAAGLCWSTGFLVYAWTYWPVLAHARRPAGRLGGRLAAALRG